MTISGAIALERLRQKPLHPATLRTYEEGLKRIERHPDSLKQLSSPIQSAVQLYFFDARGLTYRQCGEELGVTGEVIRKRLTRAMYELKGPK